ncbi:hypothetical protein L195_g060442 [Trifolium pratense]|uniref:Uncharacterized protein n=1 Tax=Trifolium pratense TaxID=57577 RepID=A0A2K3K3U6_TRIPR|nr:hypothetical protein L195_g060442 [Trifolium pratense]
MRRSTPHSASFSSELQRHGLECHSVENLEAIQCVSGSKRYNRSESQNADEQSQKIELLNQKNEVSIYNKHNHAARGCKSSNYAARVTASSGA